jgi:hypothetical protein
LAQHYKDVPPPAKFPGAAIVCGFLAAFLGYLLVSMMAPEPQVWVLFVGWLVFGIIFYHNGWSSAWLSMSNISFLLPVSVFIWGVGQTIQEVDPAARAGAGMGTLLATGLTGVVAFFFGILFAIIALYTRRPRRS